MIHLIWARYFYFKFLNLSKKSQHLQIFLNYKINILFHNNYIFLFERAKNNRKVIITTLKEKFNFAFFKLIIELRNMLMYQ